jgi:hypothetical protein
MKTRPKLRENPKKNYIQKNLKRARINSRDRKNKTARKIEKRD